MKDSKGRKIRLKDTVRADDGHYGDVVRIDGIKVKVWFGPQLSLMYYPEQLTVVSAR